MPPVLLDFSKPSEKFVLKRVKVSQHIRTYFVVCQSFSLGSEIGRTADCHTPPTTPAEWNDHRLGGVQAHSIQL
ncbi:hypothetical protein TNCV_1856701 [Trichonephila clavipes]|nr:hypothetical protein TNCV_1856701 [Trichonephila clavipes]